MNSSLVLTCQHIITHLASTRPLFVGLQGPQGSGKSFLASQLRTHLQSPPNNLQVAVLSIDDLYFPRKDLVALARSGNPLWKGRGHPGTHDTALGIEILSRLKSARGTLELPRFDKSLNGGEGDRLPLDGSGTIIEQPPAVDVIVLEGWFVGFHPTCEEEVEIRWENTWRDEKQKLGLPETVRLADIKAINDKLHEYLPLWDFLDIFIQLKPNAPPSLSLSRYSIVYKWRLEQEHYMKAHNGGHGMSDTAVKSFVDRYIPGYVFFGDLPPVAIRPSRWASQGLTLCLDEDRNVTASEPMNTKLEAAPKA